MDPLLGVSSLSSNKTFNIYIRLYSISQTIKFKAFVTDFSDQFKSSWDKTEVYGRMDPISTFKNTQRTISLALDVPSESLLESIDNAKKADYLIQGLYPVYKSDIEDTDKSKGTFILSAPPLVRVKFANLITSFSTNPINTQTSEDSEKDSEIVKTGLLGYLDGFDFKPDFEQGVLLDENGNIFPKLFKANLTLNVIHEHPLGSMVVSGKQPGGYTFTVPRLSYQKQENYSFPHSFSNAKLTMPDEAGEGNGDENGESSGVDATNGSAATTNSTGAAIEQSKTANLTGE